MRDSHEEHQLISGHYRKLLSHRIYKQSRLVFIPECNLGMEHHHLDTMVHQFDKVETFWENDKRPGIYKSARVTNEYQFLLSNLLSQGGLRFAEDLFTVTREKKPQCMRDMLEDQLLRYRWVVTKPASDADPEKRKLTGKVGNQQDDLLVATSMLVYGGRLVTRNPTRLAKL